MNHVALYRKYRPARFKDVLGQDQVVRVLEGAIAEGNISHAYLFAGSRGTGKTSIARIFAREIGTSDKDLYEIDAASNRGIDDIRALREGVAVLPFDSKYKVYIVDEVHMLTKEAFNALLKTLEEPPPHVVFILATTEVNKLPETIVSRCQTFTFKKPSSQVLKAMVQSVAKKEEFTLESSSAELIATLSEGSFRDAHGILQKIFAFSKDKKISPEEVELVTGAPKGELVNIFISALGGKEGKKALGAVAEAEKANIDMRVFLKLVLSKLRGILLLRYAPELKRELSEQFGEEDFAFLERQKDQKELNSNMLKTLLETYEQVGRSAVPSLPIELAVIDLTGGEK